MIDDPLVSVIIPVYNEESNISRMLKCVERQTYDSLEIIVINDGSTDRSDEIIRQYAAEDARIKYIKKNNGGVSSARNVGLDEASGEYVCFYDADDFVPKHAIKKMVRHAEKYNADMVIGNQSIQSLGKYRTSKFTTKLSNKKHIKKTDINLMFSFSLENRLFRRKVIEDWNIRFLDLQNAEDGCFSFQYMYRCNSITGCPSEVSRYIKKSFWQHGSLSQNRSLKAITDSEKAFRVIMRYAGLIAEECAEIDCISIERYMSIINRRALNTCIRQYYRHIWELSDDSLEEVNRFYEEFSAGLLQEDRNIVERQNKDLDMKNGLQPKSYFIDNPAVTVIVYGLKDDRKHTLRVKDVISGVYNQNMPSFELLVSKKVYNMLPSGLKSMDNIYSVNSFPGKIGFLKKAIKAARGEYVLFIDSQTIPGTSALKEMYTSIGTADYISAPMLYMKDNEYVMPELYVRLARDKEAGTFVYEKYRKSDNTVLANKLFRLSSVRKTENEFIKGICDAAVTRIPDSFCCDTCTDEPFVTEETYFEI